MARPHPVPPAPVTMTTRRFSSKAGIVPSSAVFRDKHPANRCRFDRTEDCRACIKERFYFRAMLEYQGKAWPGELLLSDSLRLGPPSIQDKTAIHGPRVILVDAEVERIDRTDALATFTVLRRQLSVFLSVLLRTLIEPPHLSTRRGWTSGLYPGLPTYPSDVRWLEYLEPEILAALPAAGSKPAMPTRPVMRPELTQPGTASDRQQEVPADIIELWQLLSNLDPISRQHFYEVGTMYQAGLQLGMPYQTASFTWLVAACEALKPRDPAFEDRNNYDVLKALLGKAHVDTLRQDALDPHDIRSVYLHNGRIRGSEFTRHLIMSSFQDPSFDHAYSVLWYFVPAAIVEWLRRGTVFPALAEANRISLRRLVRKHRVAGLALAVGACLGWLARTAVR